MCESKPVLTFYGKPNCVQCDASQRTLNGKPDETPIEYTYVDVTKDEDAYNYITRTLGYMQAPVCVVDYGNGVESHWSGFRPDKLRGFMSRARKWARDDS